MDGLKELIRKIEDYRKDIPITSLYLSDYLKGIKQAVEAFDKSGILCIYGTSKEVKDYNKLKKLLGLR